jgi:hypothetical protein
MSHYYPLGMTCVNCGKEIEAKVVPSEHGLSIKGLRNFKYRHTDETTECVIVKSPRPWDEWSATRAFDRARKTAWRKGEQE